MVRGAGIGTIWGQLVSFLRNDEGLIFLNGEGLIFTSGSQTLFLQLFDFQTWYYMQIVVLFPNR